MANSYAAYNEGLPCKNPNCNSHGKPHPNCKCYANKGIYAEGGEVAGFCAYGYPHDPGCEYFAGGGSAQAPFDARKKGSSLLNALIEQGALHGSDPVENAMLKDGSGDPISAAANAILHMGTANLLGAKGKRSSSDLAKKLALVQKDKVKNQAHEFLSGIGMSSVGVPTKQKDFLTALTSDKKDVAPHIEKVISRSLGVKSAKYLLPAALKILGSDDIDSIHESLDHAEHVSQGHKKVEEAIEALFGDGGKHETDQKDKEAIREFVEKGGLEQQLMQQSSPQMMADGGFVSPEQQNGSVPVLNGFDSVTKHWPAQAMMLGHAKGRVYNYLRSLMPAPEAQKYPFDAKTEDHERKKSYERALDLASNPLSIMNHVKEGAVTPETMNHFKGLHPEIHDHLSKKISERILKHQMDEKKPSYKLRQGISSFMGSPMDSSMSLSNLVAAQSVFAQKQAPRPQQPMTKPKRGTSHMGKTVEEHMTQDQAALARQRQ